ncbi:MAG: tRNA lysidine(34) synthetase TilS [Paracoccus sp. (in: a-proteobacteria)]|uniref:tRNA lysidine(34) synthetase TilS n=1 Tax=Paracoccus sp. TaxID=267 RepID=UPI0039E415C1
MADSSAPNPCLARISPVLDRLAAGMPRLGIALSGGGDSMALMHLAHDWGGARLFAATVDHGLRPESAAEAQAAASSAAALGIPHRTLCWRHGEVAGNVMAAARQARLDLLSAWGWEMGLSAVVLGHTLDDQAETVLMRLGRGAGVDGLSGMAERREAVGMVWLRPLLGVSRAELRDWLRGRGIGWTDDPSNRNPDFDRIRIRQGLGDLGLGAAQLAQSAQNLAMAREALQQMAAQAAEGAEARHGSLLLPLPPWRAAPAEIRRRLLVAGLRWVTGAAYPPRRAPVLAAIERLMAGGRVTLDGVIAEIRGDRLALLREPAAAARGAAVPARDEILWDNRWLLAGLRPSEQVRALGHDALRDLPWRESGLTRDEAAALPGIWSGAGLVAAPVLKSHPQVTVRPLRGTDEFRVMLYTH